MFRSDTLSDNILPLLMAQWTPPDEGSSLVTDDVTPLEPFITSSHRPASGRDRGKSG